MIDEKKYREVIIPEKLAEIEKARERADLALY